MWVDNILSVAALFIKVEEAAWAHSSGGLEFQRPRIDKESTSCVASSHQVPLKCSRQRCYPRLPWFQAPLAAKTGKKVVPDVMVLLPMTALVVVVT